MPRRQKGLIGELLGAMSRLPWWVCLALGAVAYLLLHAYATQPLPSGINPKRMQGVMTTGFARGAANVFQYVIPILCGTAALMSFVGRRKRRELLLDATEGGSTAAAIDAMSWQNFELLIAEAFRLQGFRVAEKGGAGADGGVDMELTKDGERWLVQAKHWRARRVPVEVVRELAGVMPFRRAVGGYVVTSGYFTQPAAEFARGRGIKLITGEKLDRMLMEARASLYPEQATGDLSRREPIGPLWGIPETPRCPECFLVMVRRTAKKGPNAGNEFWGCAGYPQCRGIRSV
jgi:restriction system protein